MTKLIEQCFTWLSSEIQKEKKSDKGLRLGRRESFCEDKERRLLFFFSLTFVLLCVVSEKYSGSLAIFMRIKKIQGLKIISKGLKKNFQGIKKIFIFT